MTLQKLLGGNYKWWYIISYNFKANTAYRISTFFIIIRDIIPLAISLTIYGSFIDKEGYFTYFVLGNLFYKWLSLFGDINWEISSAIKYGTLSKKLLFPISWLSYELFAVIGGNFFQVLINTLIFSLVLVIGGFVFIQSWLSLLLLACMFIMACVIYFCTDVIIGSVTFWTPETNTLIEMKNLLMPFLAGSLVFLNTNSITNIFIFLPWSFLLHHPMQIYLGKYDTNQTVIVFLGGLTWCLVLYILAKFVFKMGLKKNESVGL